MDERSAALDRRVAEAADAWLVDPRDVGAYHRLVQAIDERRTYLHPELALDEAAAFAGDRCGPVQEEEVLDDLGAGAVLNVGALLEGDPQEVLTRLRTGRTT